jgi:Peptidase family M1 domain
MRQSNFFFNGLSVVNVVLRFFCFILFLSMFSSITSASSRDWQQKVDYEMDVYLNDIDKGVKGSANITYTNNSPDTLDAIWFRLPPAALNGDSKVDQSTHRGRKNRFGKVDEHDWGDLTILKATSTDEMELKFLQDHSVGHLVLESPLLPGKTTSFTLEFATKFPLGKASYRISYSHGAYKGAYWYPSVCPYTPEYGWTVNRYYGTAEAYGEFGDYTIRYNVPNRMIVASTGELINEDEVLPPARLKGLDIHNPNPIPIPEGEEGEKRVTWIYEAKNVPDVAFVIDQEFLIDRIDYAGFEAWAFVRRGRTEEWSNAAEICGWTISELEKIYGKYPWPRVVAADARSAMEYPMLTMMTSSKPGYAYVMIHEVVHNYTPMIIHSSSVDAPVLDEGFTTFIEHELIKRWEKSDWNRERTYTRGLFSKKFTVRDDVLRGKRPYLEAVLAGEDLPMVRGADIADDYTLLRVSTYYKTPVMLNVLRTIIGEEAFWSGFKIYYEKNALTLSDENDMIEAFEEAARQPLGWFFKQFLYGSGDIDYAIKRFKCQENENDYFVNLTVERKADIRIPLKFGLVTVDGDTIRGELSFLPTDKAVKGFERWGSWDQLHETDSEFNFSFILNDDSKPKAIFLYPDSYVADRNPLDNRLPRALPNLKFDSAIYPMSPPSVDQYDISVGPAAGYNRVNKTLAGISVNGSYLERALCFSGEAYYPTDHSEDGLNWRIGGSHPISRSFGPWGVGFYAGDMHGDRFNEINIHRKWRSWNPGKRHKFKIVAGNWNKRSGGYLYYRPDIGNEKYISVEYEQIAELSYKVNFINGVEKSDFTVFSIMGSHERKLNQKTTQVLEMRFVNQSKSAPIRFNQTFGSGSRYDLLGHPVYGGEWYRYRRDRNYNTSVNTFGSINDNGALYGPEQFLICRLVFYRTIPEILRNTSYKFINRFTSKMEYGIHFALGGTNEWDRSDWDVIGELALNMRIKNLYGVSLESSVILASNKIRDRLLEGEYDNFPTVYLKMSIDSDRFFR